VFEERELRRIVGPEGEEMRGDSRKLLDDKRYSSLNVIRVMKWRWDKMGAGHVALER
jgi:hypothetical protein